MFGRRYFRRKNRKLREKIATWEARRAAEILLKLDKEKKAARKYIMKRIVKRFDELMMNLVVTGDQLLLNVKDIVRGEQAVSSLVWRDDYYELTRILLAENFPSFKFTIPKDVKHMILLDYDNKIRVSTASSK